MSTEVPQPSNVRRSEQTGVKTIIKAHPGRQNAIPSTEIANRVNRKPTTVRDIVQELIADGALIGSCSDGYYWLATESEFRQEMDSLDSQRDETDARMSALASTWYDSQEDADAH